MYDKSVKSTRYNSQVDKRVNWSLVARRAGVSRQTVWNWRKGRHETKTRNEYNIREAIAEEYGTYKLINILNAKS